MDQHDPNADEAKERDVLGERSGPCGVQQHLAADLQHHRCALVRAHVRKRFDQRLGLRLRGDGNDHVVPNALSVTY